MSTTNASRDGRAGWVLLALALVPAAFLLVVILRYGVNLPFLDHWTLAGLFKEIEQGTLTLGDLTAQHNESRMFFPRLLVLPLAYLSGWNVRLEMLVSFLLACLVSINVYRLGRASFPDRRLTSLGLLVPANLLIFSVVQWQNWLWGFQLVAFLPIALLTSSLVVACSRWSITSRVVVNIVLATIASFSFSSGLLCWFVVLPVLMLLDWSEFAKRRWLVAAWLAAAAANFTLYFATYTHPENHPVLGEALRRVLDAIVFFAAFLGAPVAWVIGRDSGATLSVSAGIGFVLSALFLVCAATVWLQRTSNTLRRRAAPWLGIGAFALLSGGMLTMARVGFGTGYALQSRYSTAALYLCVALIFLIRVLLEEGRRTGGPWGWPSMSHAAVALLMLLVAAHAITSVRLLPNLPILKQQRLVGKAMLTLLDVAPDVQGLGRFVFPFVDELPEVARSVDRQGLLDPPLLSSNRVLQIAEISTGDSHGALERYAPRPDALILRGWAILPDRGEPAHAVLLCHEIPGDEPRIFAVAATGIARPDVVEREGRAGLLGSGWEYRRALTQPLRRDMTVSAWAFDTLTRKAFRLEGSVEVGSVEIRD